ncbi:hypothetical protein ACHAWT_000631 [Skeletonema menzelii]
MNNPQPNNNEELHGYQINCCPIRYVRSDIQPLPPSSTTPLALEERVSSIPSISFSRNSSRSSRTHSSVHSERGIAKPQSILRNSSYATTDADDEEQPDTNIDLQRSISAKAGEDASVQGRGIGIAAIPFGHDKDEQQAPQPRGRSWKTGATIASVCVCLGLCGIVIGLSLSTNSIVTKVMQRYGFVGDRDGDGISDELEALLGLDPSKYDKIGEEPTGPTSSPILFVPTNTPTTIEELTWSTSSEPTNLLTSPPTKSSADKPTSPSLPTSEPTPDPTNVPTASPSPDPTSEPTASPSLDPTSEPTAPPSPSPTKAPTAPPSLAPTSEPTSSPSLAPTKVPTAPPSPSPTRVPTASPSPDPTSEPTASPSLDPTSEPTAPPSPSPTKAPTAPPSSVPTTAPPTSPQTNIPTYI